MKHLGYLKILNFAYAVLMVLLALMAIVVGGGAAILKGADLGTGLLLLNIIVLVIVVAFLAVVAFLHFRLGQEVEQGRWRTAQTVFIVLHMFNCPGVFYSAYAVWVCWINEETKAVFEGQGAAVVPESGS